MIDYGDYYADLPAESQQKESLMNIEPPDGPMDKETQELIDKMLAEDQQAFETADPVKEKANMERYQALNGRQLSIEKHKNLYMESKK